MSARIYGGIPLTLLMAVTLLQSGAAAGWWAAVMPEAAALSTLAAWAAGLWLLWQIDVARMGDRQAAVPPPTAAPAAARARPQQHERRRSPRFNLECPVEISMADRGALRGELRDISQGGARIAGAALLDPGSYGVLRIAGITLPVPFRVVASTAGSELRVRFEISGLALETFIRQLERLVAQKGADIPAVQPS